MRFYFILFIFSKKIVIFLKISLYCLTIIDVHYIYIIVGKKKDSNSVQIFLVYREASLVVVSGSNLIVRMHVFSISTTLVRHYRKRFLLVTLFQFNHLLVMSIYNIFFSNFTTRIHSILYKLNLFL